FCALERAWRLPMNLFGAPALAGPVRLRECNRLKPGLQTRHGFMVTIHARKRVLALHEPASATFVATFVAFRFQFVFQEIECSHPTADGHLSTADNGGDEGCDQRCRMYVKRPNATLACPSSLDGGFPWSHHLMVRQFRNRRGESVSQTVLQRS